MLIKVGIIICNNRLSGNNIIFTKKPEKTKLLKYVDIRIYGLLMTERAKLLSNKLAKKNVENIAIKDFNRDVNSTLKPLLKPINGVIMQYEMSNKSIKDNLIKYFFLDYNIKTKRLVNFIYCYWAELS